VLGAAALNVRIDGGLRRLSCTTPGEKDATYRTLYRWLRSIEEADARAFVRELCSGIGFDPAGLCAELMLNWQEIRELAADPLATIGAHTRRHFALAKLTFAEAQAEIEESVRRIERETRRPCRHFSFPYGDAASAGTREFAMVREFGLKTAVTGQRGLIHSRHAREPTALPSIALNGDYQKARYVKVLLSGAPFAFFNLVHRPAGAA
jgi:Polysaccharide deacetylase